MPAAPRGDATWNDFFGFVLRVRLANPLATAISQASPGPLGLYVVVVGYFVAGVPGAIAAALALATPAILAIPIARAVRRHRDAQLRGASAAIVIASCVLMATTSVTLASGAAPTA